MTPSRRVARPLTGEQIEQALTQAGLVKQNLSAVVSALRGYGITRKQLNILIRVGGPRDSEEHWGVGNFGQVEDSWRTLTEIVLDFDKPEALLLHWRSFGLADPDVATFHGRLSPSDVKTIRDNAPTAYQWLPEILDMATEYGVPTVEVPLWIAAGFWAAEFRVEDAKEVQRWRRTVGSRAAWYAAAGYEPDEAHDAEASGGVPQDQLLVLAQLRGFRPGR